MSVQSAVKQLADALTDAHEGLKQSEAQVVFYKSQVIKIDEAYKALTAILPPEEFNVPTVKKAGRKGAKPKAHKTDFPKTDSAFWLGLITATPQKTTDILAAGAKKLGFAADDKEKIATLKQRMPTNLQNLINDKKISSAGERLNRTYFR